MKPQQTLFEKIWDKHVVSSEPGAPTLLYVDLHLVHEVTSPQAFSGLRSKGLKVRRPDKTFATIDHSVPTLDGPNGRMNFADDMAVRQVRMLEENCAEFGIPLFDLENENQGIVHIIGPELGLTQPGKTIVCGDSHTATHGAFGALAFGIGTSEVEHVLASQCLLQNKPKTFEVRVEGNLKSGVTSKDIILALIAKVGVGGGTGHVFEYKGSAVRSLTMEQRMTLCNMSIEGGARAGMVAPDETTFEFLAGRRFVPQGKDWDRAIDAWSQLISDPDAKYDQSVYLDANDLKPMITFGTNPSMGIAIDQSIPTSESYPEGIQRSAFDKAMAYMDLTPGQKLIGKEVQVVFIGSCTNGRLSDLQAAASLLKGRKIAQGLRVLVVPGSQEVKRLAEIDGLDKIFKESGAEWREPGCSMCIAMNGDQLEPGQYAVSTSNRNFEGRQGKGGRTFLASPLTAAATALNGYVTDPRTMF